jgi:hypothetical protein
MVAAIRCVGNKEAAKEEDFRKKENPHPELVRIELLFEVVKVMGKLAVVVVRTHFRPP